MALDLDKILEGYRNQYPPTLNTAQVAEMLGSSAEVVRSKVATGELPAYRWGKNFRFFRDEVLDWLRNQTVSARIVPDAETSDESVPESPSVDA